MRRVASLAGAALLSVALGAAHAAAPSAVYDHRAYEKAVGDISAALGEGDFDRLESLYRTFAWPGSRSADGVWMVQSFQAAFERRFAYEPPAAVEKLFASWKARGFDSDLRAVAEAFAWQQRAMLAKGRSCYAQSPPSARKAFNALLERAARALAESEARGRESPLWDTAVILVAGGQGRPAHELDALLEQGARRFPGYWPLHAARMRFLLPDWGGDFDAVDRFVRGATERNAIEGKAFYAWLYLDIAAQGECEGWFAASRVDWPAMRNAFEDMLERHPGVWNRNLFATFACRARDVPTTLRLLGELGAQAALGAHSRGVSTANCREMARTVPEPQMRSGVEPLLLHP